MATKAEVRAARAGMTQEQAAHIIGRSRRTWQAWEAGDREMPDAMLAGYRILCGQEGMQESPSKEVLRQQRTLCVARRELQAIWDRIGYVIQQMAPNQLDTATKVRKANGR